jgi:hypothetical protein
MSRAWLGLLLVLCATPAWAQYPIYPGGAQAFIPPYAYGYNGFGYGGIGYGGYGGFGAWPYGFAARGYYPPNPFGNMNWLPPILPSPYYSVPSGPQYLQQAAARDQATYTDLMLKHEQEKQK